MFHHGPVGIHGGTKNRLKNPRLVDGCSRQGRNSTLNGADQDPQQF